jgi:DNA-binding response OmpR family regulator
MPYKILTVDDSRTIRMIVKKAFKPYDCVMIEAENGMEGLSAAAKEKPDLIVLDITMPVMTGIEMLAKLKEQSDLKEIPVIMLTAESGKDNVMQIVKMGVKDYIVKPFKGEQLIERAGAILDLRPGAESVADSGKDSDTDFFKRDGEYFILRLPAKISRNVAAKVDTALKDKIGEIKSSGKYNLIFDLTRVGDVNMTAIQLIITMVNASVRSKVPSRLVVSGSQAEALKSFQETGSVETYPSIEDAMGSF